MNQDAFANVRSLLDRPVDPQPEKAGSWARLLRDQGYGAMLAEFAGALAAAADSGTFCNGAFRLHPFEGRPANGLPGLAAWNDRRGWKQFEPARAFDTFYLASNSFGDLFGIPLGEDRDIARPRISILWVERYEYQEAGLDWATFLASMQRGNDIAAFFARLPAHDWAGAALGLPQPWQCFSANVPMMLGGKNSLENVAIQSLPVHVSFTLQVLRLHAAGALKPGSPLPKADLYDGAGNLAAG